MSIPLQNWENVWPRGPSISGDPGKDVSGETGLKCTTIGDGGGDGWEKFPEEEKGSQVRSEGVYSVYSNLSVRTDGVATFDNLIRVQHN